MLALVLASCSQSLFYSDDGDEAAGFTSRAAFITSQKRAAHANIEDPLLLELQTQGFARLGNVIENTQIDGYVLKQFESVQFVNGYTAEHFVATLKEKISESYGAEKTEEFFAKNCSRAAATTLVMTKNVTDSRIGDFNITVSGNSYTSLFYWWWDYRMYYQDLSWNNSVGNTFADSIAFQLFHKEITHPVQAAQAALWDPKRASTVIVKNLAAGYSDFSAYTEDWNFDYLGRTIAEQAIADFDYTVVTVTENSVPVSYKVDSSGWSIVSN